MEERTWHKASELNVGDTHPRSSSRTSSAPSSSVRRCVGDYNPVHTDEVFVTKVAGYPRSSPTAC